MQITFQYFEECPNWQTTHQRLLLAIGDRDDVEVVMQRVETIEHAAEVGFAGSPTILVNGSDPFAADGAPRANALSCRLYPTGDGSPAVEQLQTAIAETGNR